MSQFFYGSFFHAANSVSFESIQRTLIRGETKRAYLLNVKWNIRGKLVSSADLPQQDINTQLNEIILAYSVDGLSAGMLDNFGGLSPFTMNGAVALNGIRITSPVSHGTIEASEGTTYLYYKIGMEADFPASNQGSVMSFNESITFENINGSPMTVNRLPFNGPPIIQQITQQSWYRAVQQGSMVTAFNQPSPMTPIFALAFIDTSDPGASSVKYDSPKTIAGYPTTYGVNWRYRYVSSSPLIAFPNIVG